jgi:hypothetical protein
MKKIKRTPRPFGTTLLNQTQNKEIIIQHTIRIYTQNQYKLNNTTYTFQQVAQYLNIGIQQVMAEVMKINMKAMENLVDGDRQQEAYQSMIGMAIFETLGDRQKLLQQLELVSQSQGKAYKPFVTAEYNNLLSTLIRSQGGLFEVAKLLKPGNGPKGLPMPTTGPTQNIAGNVIYTNGANQAMGSEALTVDKASQMIQALKAPLDLDNLSSYVSGAPEVKALGQESAQSKLLSGTMDEDYLPEPTFSTHAEFKAHQSGMDDMVPID